MNRPRVAVIGGGVAGLAVSYELAQRSERLPQGVEVLCLEAADRAGGNIRSAREGGFLVEWAANGFLDNAPATVTLVRRLGLEERMLKAGEKAARRFIYRKRRLRELPLTPPAFLMSDVISLRGKLRLLCEPFVAARRSVEEESVFDFASRRVGREAATVLIDALVSGVYAGDTRRLSLDAAFPKLRRLESEHGGLVRGSLAKRKQARAEGREAGFSAGPGGVLTSFPEGLQELTDTLAATLGPRLRLNARVDRLSDLGNRGFRVHLAEGAPLDVDAVVVACPAWHAASIVRPLDEELAGALDGIPSARLAVVHLGYRCDALGPEPEGFGFLVPRGQGPRILGTLCASNIFSGRAPDGSLLLTSMIGGAHDPEAWELDDATLERIVTADLRTTLRIEAPPYFKRIIRWPRGIAQYDLGHVERRATVERRLRELSGLWVGGQSLRGISINSCIEEASEVAESALEFLGRRPAATVGGRV